MHPLQDATCPGRDLYRTDSFCSVSGFRKTAQFAISRHAAPRDGFAVAKNHDNREHHDPVYGYPRLGNKAPKNFGTLAATSFSRLYENLLLV